ncbi:MAG: primosomal protein N', partial [Pseudomonadota bacterium]
LNRHPADEGLSAPLREAIAAQLDAGGQALIYLNRRGFAPAMICTGCGAIEHCRRCDARLTFHASRQALECHHCGQGRPLSRQCSTCGKAVTPLGEGTERIEDVLKRYFPGEPLVRIDSDTTRGRNRFEAAFDEAVSGRARLLVGTQMLSKGHHFPELGLVGVLNADQGLFGSDFRAAERLAQSLIQVAGRAGRAERPGQVLIQTAFAQHPLLKTLVEEGYRGFAERALNERGATGWPPFSNLALLRAAATDRAAVWRYLNDVAGELRRLAGADCDVFGPVAALMERRAGRYRAQLLIRAANRRALRAVLAPLRPGLDEHPGARRVRWSLDIDPVDLF